MKAKITEVFKSFQGEGIYQGALQIFIRFYGCNLDCKFCDTPQKDYQEFSSQDLLKQLDQFGQYYHSLSLTGGEPLLHKDFLADFLSLTQQRNDKIYLETNGTLYNELAALIKHIDIIAMDIKLSSSTGNKKLWEEHKRFLDVALQKDVFIKVVISSSTDEGELIKSLNLVKSFNSNIPFILQPEYNDLVSGRLEGKLEEFLALSIKYLNFVRVIPQMHKTMGVR